MTLRLRTTIVVSALALPCALSLHGGVAHAGKKVTICHVPPGNPSNRHTISVCEAAVGAHLAHGDQLGACFAGCGADPSVCDDGNACTSDFCGTDGSCGHDAVSCVDGNVCTVDSCDPVLGCTQVANDGAACDDGSDCTSGDACSGTTCEGEPIAGCCASDDHCDDGAACTIDMCSDGLCSNEAVDCSVADLCFAGFCDVDGECDVTPVSCDDGDFCTDDACDANAGCMHTWTASPPEAVEASCNDGLDNDCDGMPDDTDPDCSSCGDGVLHPGEQCDDGNDNPFDGCDDCIVVDTTPD